MRDDFHLGSIEHSGERNMLVGYLGDMQLVVHNGNQPGKQEWTRYLHTVLAEPDTRYGMVYTLKDGGPNAAQRAEAQTFWEKKAPHRLKFAIMTESTVVRHAITVMSWVSPQQFKGFPPTEIGAALAYLGTSVPELLARQTLRKMATELKCPGALGGI